jgi:hypothetical protein
MMQEVQCGILYKQTYILGKMIKILVEIMEWLNLLAIAGVVVYCLYGILAS